MYAAHNRVDNLIATVDYNGQQIDGPVNKILNLLDLKAKWEAFGWAVHVLEHGNNLAEVNTTLEKAKSLTSLGKPQVVLMKTQMGYGVDYMMGSHKWHGTAPNNDQLQLALSQLSSNLTDY